ncbi:MAG: hypothetical protein M1826_000253 [Phylliscum demangeonii]|nr:MAG: hypothetical protein M1826_000253 [Phylliscum demangeonii]
MFSEYASHFLAQSQSRISSFRGQTPAADQAAAPSSSTNLAGSRRLPRDTRDARDARSGRYPPSSRSYVQRQTPYQAAAAAAHLLPFPFASRPSGHTPAQAPLFYSATDEFREEDDETERDRDAADLYALQRSRRHFAAGRPLDESSETVADGSRGSDLDLTDGRAYDGRGRGIRSSWTGPDRRDPRPDGDEGQRGGEGRDNDNGDSAQSSPQDPPAFHPFIRKTSADGPGPAVFLPYDNGDEEATTEAPPRRASTDSSSVPASLSPATIEPPYHDPFWSSLYFISLAAFLATFFLVYLHTTAPTEHRPLGDSIYTALRASVHLLAVDTLVAVVVSLLWLSVLRAFMRPLVYGMVVAVPVVFLALAIYPFAYAAGSPGAGRPVAGSGQDQVLRWAALVPALAALGWTYAVVVRGRRALQQAIAMLEFSCRIVAGNAALVLLGFGTLAAVVVWTWVWMGMFTRVFLGGHLIDTAAGRRVRFTLDASTWWLAAFFVVVYLWTLAVIGGVQRATTAATVSQWYFHRNRGGLGLGPAPPASSAQIVRAALHHASLTSLGSICLSTLLTLLIRLPLLLLRLLTTMWPRRVLLAFVPLGGAVPWSCCALLPSLVWACAGGWSTSAGAAAAALTHPLTLSHAAIYSQPLALSSRSIAPLLVARPPTPVRRRRRRRGRGRVRVRVRARPRPRLPTGYRFALLLLHATRAVMSVALGLAGWVRTARVSGAGARAGSGSLYAYVVGLMAAVIGWAVLGAVEGVLVAVLDAAVVCWAGAAGSGYCLEAERLFGRGAGGGRGMGIGVDEEGGEDEDEDEDEEDEEDEEEDDDDDDDDAEGGRRRR